MVLQVVVFLMAGVVVVAFIISAVHFVKALHQQQQAENRLHASYRRDLEGVGAAYLCQTCFFSNSQGS